MDQSLRTLQRLASNGSQDAQQRYIAALERVAGISSDPTPEIYQAKKADDKGVDVVFPYEPIIYRESYCPMLHVYFKGLPDIGFTLQDFPEDHWDWLLGSVSKQISKMVEKAYQLGVKKAQKDMRKALGMD